MKVGMLARNTITGLGMQTFEVHANLQPDVTVVVDPGKWAQTPPRLDWYPDGHTIEWTRDRRLPGAFETLKDCDVVYSAESFYDPQLSRKLANAGTATVLHVNPELHDPNHTSHWATTYWTPTSWLQNLVPDSTVVPMPCPTHRYDEPWTDSPPRIVHPAARAMADRHGTQIVERIAPRLVEHGWLVDIVGPGHREVDEYWQRDPGATLSILPRRYGGLSLPVLEAFSAGVPVVMPTISPNNDWPIIGVTAQRNRRDVKMKAGPIPVYDVAQSRLLNTVVALMSDPQKLEQQRKVVYQWAQEHSWQTLKPVWLEAMEAARL